MKLITKALEKVFSRYPIYSTDGKPAEEKKALAVFFTPWGVNTWIVAEAEKQENGDYTFFGYVKTDLTYGQWEWGYFTLSEMASIRGPWGLKIEREMYTTPAKYTVAEIVSKH